MTTSTNYNQWPNKQNYRPSFVTASYNEPIRIWVLPNKLDVRVKFSDKAKPISNYLPEQKSKSILVFKDIIVEAQNVLGISKTHLALIFKMSRQNLDYLLKNNEKIPRPDTQKRIINVKKALDIIHRVYPHKLGASTLTYRNNGDRLFDVLINDDIDFGKVKSFTEKINEHIRLQQQSSLPESVIKNQEFIDSFNAI